MGSALTLANLSEILNGDISKLGQFNFSNINFGTRVREMGVALAGRGWASGATPINADCLMCLMLLPLCLQSMLSGDLDMLLSQPTGAPAAAPAPVGLEGAVSLFGSSLAKPIGSSELASQDALISALMQMERGNGGASQKQQQQQQQGPFENGGSEMPEQGSGPLSLRHQLQQRRSEEPEAEAQGRPKRSRKS